MRILIAAGGTGGHVIPALTIASDLSQRGHSIKWFGTKSGIEAKLVSEAGFDIEYIKDLKGIRGKSLAHWLFAPFKIVRSIIESISLIRRYKPHGILAMGGYVAGPIGVAAWLMRVPLVIHEQNAIAGTTNKILTKFSKNILCAYDGAFSSKVNALPIGNPVRNEFESFTHYTANNEFPNKINVLVIGGSLGAKDVNSTVADMLLNYNIRDKVRLVHQVGKHDFDRMKSIYSGHKVDVALYAYIENMVQMYTWADLVISRSGAMSVAEISAAGLPSILVPYPHATDQHQYYNARYLEQSGAAILINQSDLDAKRLSESVNYFLESPYALISMAEKAKRLHKPDIASNITDYCLEKFA